MKWSTESVIKQLKDEWSWVSGWWEYQGGSAIVVAAGLVLAVFVVACLFFFA